MSKDQKHDHLSDKNSGNNTANEAQDESKEAEDASYLPKPDFSGEVMDPVFDDSMPVKPSSDYMPDPHFDEEHLKPQKRKLTEKELQELSGTVPEGVNLSDDNTEEETQQTHRRTPDEQRAPTNPFYESDEPSQNAADIPASEVASDSAASEDNGEAEEDSDMPRAEPHERNDFDIPDDFSAEAPKIDTDKLSKGEDSELSLKDPALKQLYVGVGWDMDHFEGEPLDLDLSCFLLNKNDMTRCDTDFVFYNNLKGADLAVQHSGDNRTGMGEGDDEVITIDLEALPFEIWKIVFVVSIYMGDEEGLSFNQVKNAFIRIANKETRVELARFDLSNDFGDGTCLRFGELMREGSNWRFHADGSFEKGGLSKIAQSYGLLIAGT